MSDGLRTIKCWCTGQGSGADSLVHILRIEVLRGGDVVCGGELFSATGLRILRRNYLEVYIYDKWGDKFIPDFEEGHQFMPSICELREGQTTSPSYLTEADLVSLMDKNGIGESE